MRTSRVGPTDGASLRAHVEELLAEHLISADYDTRSEPHADLERRHVVLEPVLEEGSYLMALQQIGRIVTGGGAVEAEVWAFSRALQGLREPAFA